MTLALLLTAVGGAWADETLLLTIESKDNTSFTSGSKTFDDKVTVTFSNSVDNYGDYNGWYSGLDPSLLTVAGINGYTITSCKFYTEYGNAMTGYTVEGESPSVYLYVGEVYTDNSESVYLGSPGIKKIEVYGAAASSATAIDVKWNASTKTGTFVMPDCDVEIAPIYAPVAAFDLKEGSEDKLPAAVEGIFIESTDAIITAGSCAQGTLMYAVSTSGTEQPALTAFSADLPTAKDITTAGDVYVWYYIKGADTPEGQEPTEKNTFNDSEICTTPLKVTVLNNKFNILFTAANANTIEAGKATVTVGGTAATVTEGKLEGVKMGSEVKVTAKEGYKFRKVEAKKHAEAGIVNPVVGQVIGSDGNNYDATATLPDGVTAVAMIDYVGSETYDDTYKNGLAIALADEAESNWSTAMSTCEGKTAITGAKWCLPSQDQWKQMFKANGGNDASYTGLNTTITTAGGTILKNTVYWSSSESSPGSVAYVVSLVDGGAYWGYMTEDNVYQVRACLAFAITDPNAIDVTTNAAEDETTFTEASFTMPGGDVNINYELIRDMTVAVSAKVGDGTDGYRFSIYKKEGGTYDLVDKAADYPEIMDNIDAKNPAEVAAKDYELQLQKLGDDGKTWANTTDYSPGTFRLMVTGKEGYDGTIYTNTYVLYEQTSITFAKGYSTHYYTESLVLDEKQDGLKFYAVTAVTDEKVTLTEIEAKAIPAETPFIAYNAGAEAVTAKMGLLKADDVTSAEQFKGTAEDKTMAAQSGCYVLRNGDSTPTFRLVEGAGTLPAHRCWIELGTSSSARVLNVEFDGNKTAISIISVDVDNAGDWYDLQGRKLQGAPLRKGAYIHNGKTIIIK